MGREFELKYRADEKTIAAIRAEFGGFTPISMETTYYDTSDAALSRLRWTLRRRYENGVSVCTVKTPEKGGARGEWETECGDIVTAVPRLCALGAPAALKALAAEGLVQVCGAKFTRLAAKVTLPECTVELALDQGCLLGGGKELPFAEVEVELKEGSEDAAIAFAQDLSTRFGLVAEPASKYRRALALSLQ